MEMVIAGVAVMAVCGIALLGGIYMASVTDRSEADEAAAASLGPVAAQYAAEVVLAGRRVEKPLRIGAGRR